MKTQHWRSSAAEGKLKHRLGELKPTQPGLWMGPNVQPRDTQVAPGVNRGYLLQCGYYWMHCWTCYYYELLLYYYDFA